MHGEYKVMAISYLRTLSHRMRSNLCAVCQQKFACRFFILRVVTLLKIRVCCGLMNIYCVKLEQSC
jgi:hypothetical protein